MVIIIMDKTASMELIDRKIKGRYITTKWSEVGGEMKEYNTHNDVTND